MEYESYEISTNQTYRFLPGRLKKPSCVLVSTKWSVSQIEHTILFSASLPNIIPTQLFSFKHLIWQSICLTMSSLIL